MFGGYGAEIHNLGKISARFQKARESLNQPGNLQLLTFGLIRMSMRREQKHRLCTKKHLRAVLKFF
ncbi:MAG: hypothetical protein CM1200mP30_32470 [Pseudomonadota bacterium]|nr:MAG: hypothetical protein CM1200mP30_32470 [Pseudomonadota bacterium]